MEVIIISFLCIIFYTNQRLLVFVKRLVEELIISFHILFVIQKTANLEALEMFSLHNSVVAQAGSCKVQMFDDTVLDMLIL